METSGRPEAPTARTSTPFGGTAGGPESTVPTQWASSTTAHAEGAKVLAWLNNGTGRYAVLKSTEFGNADALRLFAWGLTIRAAGGFNYVFFFGDGTYLKANAAFVVTGVAIEP